MPQCGRSGIFNTVFDLHVPVQQTLTLAITFERMDLELQYFIYADAQAGLCHCFLHAAKSGFLTSKPIFDAVSFIKL